MPQRAARGAERRPSRKNPETALADQGIVVPCPAAVRTYLASHRALAKIMPKVCEQARREFGQEAELSLSVRRDPEIDDRYLRLCIRLPAYDDRTIARMDTVTDVFDDELCRASGCLLLTTDFRPLRGEHGI